MGAVRTTLIAISVVLMTNEVSAKYALGPGGVSCEAWLEARRSRGAEALQLQSWVLGYVSGVNAGQSDDADFLVKLDALAIFAWLDSYCPQHPLDKLISASNMQIDDLQKRAAAAGAKTK